MVGIFFGQKIRSRFTRKADVDDFDLLTLREEPAFYVGHVIAGLGDAVAKKNDSLNASERCRSGVRLGGHGHRFNQGKAQEKELFREVHFLGFHQQRNGIASKRMKSHCVWSFFISMDHALVSSLNPA